MGGLIQTPHLAIPQQPASDPLEKYGQLLSIQKLAAGQQLQQSQIQNAQLDTQSKQLEVAQQQQDQKDQTNFRAAFQQANGDPDQAVKLAAQAGVGPKLLVPFQQSILEHKTKLLGYNKEQQAFAQSQADLQKGAWDTVNKATEADRPQVYQQQLQGLQDMGVNTSKMPPQYDPQGFALMGAVVSGHKQTLENTFKQAETAKDTSAAKLSDIEAQLKQQDLNFGAKVPQLNDALTQRYQVLHPGQSLPAPFTLGQNASKADFDRIDKILEATERSQGTKAQQDTANAMREQTLALTKSTKDLTPVIGQDAQGNDVLVPKSQADDMALKNPMKAGEQEVGKAQAARHWIPLATAQGDPKDPSTMGILPLIDKLDTEGKLGVVASRWNDFLAGKVGSADPDVAALRAKMGLSTTLLMNAHVGSRGGSYMLEHFQDLADSGKMDAPTLKSGVKSELNYIEGRAMLPKTASTAQQQTQQGGAQTGGSGKTVSLAAAKQLPQNKGKTDEEIKADIVKYGHTVAP